MPIRKISINNFKGVAETTELDIRPITLFIGPNSSGKSSAIHALACLAQTVKLANSSLPIVLDDEYAQVHLGRFIEVIHSHTYTDTISLGVDIGVYGHNIAVGNGELVLRSDDEVSANYQFGCTKRTQEIRLTKASLVAGKQALEISAPDKDGNYRITHSGKEIGGIKANLRSGLSFSYQPLPKAKPQDFINSYILAEQIQSAIGSGLRNTLYLGPFRQSPRRRYPTRGASPIEVGAEGEAAVTMLANESIQSRKRPNCNQVSNWMSVLGLANKLDVSRVGASDLFDVSVTLMDGQVLPIADLGYGLSQIMPVLVQCSFAPNGSTLLFEQPELHLHPGAARRLMKIFIHTAKAKKAHIIAETHSRELMLKLLEEMRLGNIMADEVAVYSVERIDGKSAFKRINIEQEAEYVEALEKWDKGLD